MLNALYVYSRVFNHSLSISWIKVKAFRSITVFVQFGNLFFLSYFLLQFYVIQISFNSVHIKDMTGLVFAHPMKVLHVNNLYIVYTICA